jgi:steroid delta-isomerase-like uncharacterized protein
VSSAPTSGLSTRASAVAQAWSSAWNQGDTTLLEALLDPEYQRHSAGSKGSQTSAELIDTIQAARAAFPDLHTTIDAVIEEGDHLAVFWHSTGTHQNEFLGVPSTRRTVETFGSNHCVFSNGKVVAENVTWDPRQLLTALGIISLESE